MALTLQQKFDALHAAEDRVRAAFADLIDASTGEAIAPGESAFDVACRQVFANVGGKLERSKPRIIQSPKAAT